MRLFAPLRRSLSFGGHISAFQRLGWLCRFQTWRVTMLFETIQRSDHPDTVAILLSYKRPYNIDPIVRLLLATPSIAKVIVSNNNPEIRISDWLSVSDPRLTVIEHVIAQPSHLRYDIAARETTYQRFIAVDDDMFLKPSQLETVCTALRSDPSRPHGVTGMMYDSWRGMLYHNMNSRTQSVDVVHGIYAFTSDHVVAFFQLLREAGFSPAHPEWRCSYWDDLFLSFAAGTPKVEYVGTYLECPSHSEHGVAGWTSPGFFRLRLPLLLTLRRLRPKRG